MITIARQYLDDYRQRFAEIGRRLEETLSRFTDKEVNWRPNKASNSAANLVMHICGNIGQRFGHAIRRRPDTRDRAAEFDTKVKRKVPELLGMLREGFAMIDDTLDRLTLAMLYEVVRSGGKEITIQQLISGCAAHYSEHLGQIIYLDKMRPFPAKK